MTYWIKTQMGEFKTTEEKLTDRLEFITALWSTRGIVDFEAGEYTIGHCKRNNGQHIPGQLYFEHNEEGEDHAGGLWFDGATLDDYDGTYCLPRAVGRALRDLGITVDDDCFSDDGPYNL